MSPDRDSFSKFLTMQTHTASIILNLTKIVCPLCKKAKFRTKFMLRRHIKHSHSEEEAEEFLKKSFNKL